ncbi:RadC family protein [Nocardia sp. NPDC057440]|uniref:JAB domain-containing protein n=1 Tax=Nocardia sp. NPDC057440 TaxID=3346134 RepID=UPI00366F387F
MRLRDLPAADRPRERMLERGAEALSDRELLALLLGSGARDLDAMELAAQVIESQGGLKRLARAEPHELVGLLGVGPAKATRVAAAFQLARRAFAEEQSVPRRITTTAELAACASPLLHGLRHERVVIVVCDKSGTLLRTVRLTEGATDHSLIPVRDVLTTVLATGGVTFGVAHNHPSGNPEPSDADRSATDRLREASESVGLRFLDHIVITDCAWRRITTSPRRQR